MPKNKNWGNRVELLKWSKQSLNYLFWFASHSHIVYSVTRKTCCLQANFSFDLNMQECQLGKNLLKYYISDTRHVHFFILNTVLNFIRLHFSYFLRGEGCFISFTFYTGPTLCIYTNSTGRENIHKYMYIFQKEEQNSTL